MSALGPPPGPRHRFTVEQAHRLVELGIVDPDAPYEFVRGEFYYRPRHEVAHSMAIGRLEDLYRNALPEPAGWTGRVPIVCGEDSLPEPDFIVLRDQSWLAERRYARAEEALLVVEVGVSSLPYDRWKARLYAEAGALEYWVMDAATGRLERHRQPLRDEGRYADFRLLDREAFVELPALGRVIQVADLFSPGQGREGT